jgi:hypothetical protein
MLDDGVKVRLTTWLVDQHNAGATLPQVTTETIERARSARRLTVPQRRNRLIQAVSLLTPELGQRAEYRLKGAPYDAPAEENPYWAQQATLLAWTESRSAAELETLIQYAKSEGLLELTNDLCLTFYAHTVLAQMSEEPRTSNQAFVAMWFGAGMSDAYDHGIEPAISSAGYAPMRIDRKEHNNKIDDEIIAEIRRSRFLVADFTCGMVNDGTSDVAIPRGGVYYEAGFAQGLGIPVIWMCRSDHINHVHFDTRQFNHITWDSPGDLKIKLENRIGAVLGDGPLKAR